VIFIRDEILPHSKVLPSAFINKIIATINEGSIHSLAGRPVVGRLLRYCDHVTEVLH
jgi:hypothetical protein